jgi:hypothetical protein
VDEYGVSKRRREPEDFNHLVSRRAWRVLETHADTQRTRFNLASKRREHPIKTLARGRLIGGGTGLRNYSGLWPEDAGGQWNIPGEETRCQVRSACTEVNGSTPATCIDETVNIGNADFELQRGCNPVQSLEAIRFLALPMLMQINEAWGDNQAARVDRPSASQRFSGNLCDRVTANPHVADRVQVGLRVNDAAGLQDDIEWFRGPRARAQPA